MYKHHILYRSKVVQCRLQYHYNILYIGMTGTCTESVAIRARYILDSKKKRGIYQNLHLRPSLHAIVNSNHTMALLLHRHVHYHAIE